MRVGWIGLGAMGSPMAARLGEEGHQVVGYDIDPSRADPLTAVAGSIAEAVADAEAVVVMVATSDQGEAVLFDPAGAADALPDGAVVVVTATVGPDAVTGWAERLAATGIRLVDAPVSGGVERARTGRLLVLASGASNDLRAVEPVLRALGGDFEPVGGKPGDGQKVKLVNQLLCGVHIAAAAEALGFAEALGLHPARCLDLLVDGAAASFMLEDRGPRMVEGTYTTVRSALDLFVKDMGLVTETARRSDYPVPLATAAGQLYVAGRRAGLGRLDDSSLVEVARGRAGGFMRAR
jgi:3-hydroxyisobutyrate dehydrogenase/putative dehydrogenase